MSLRVGECDVVRQRGRVKGVEVKTGKGGEVENKVRLIMIGGGPD